MRKKLTKVKSKMAKMVRFPGRRLISGTAAVLRICVMILLLGSSGSVESPAERLTGMKNLAVCYGDWGQCDSKVLTAARQGCNVIVWFAINIRLNATTGSPLIMGGISNSKRMFTLYRHPGMLLLY
jgi:hypothetical protein